MELTKYMKPLNLSSWDTMFNLDGYATWNGMRNPQITSYDQLFRNGIYESYTSTMLAEMSFNNGTKLMAIDGVSFIPDVIKKIIGGVNVLKKFQIDAPFVVMISIYGVKDAVIYSKTHFNWSRPFLGNEIYLPPAILPESEKDIYKTLKPYFDIIWQSVSENQSPEISYL